MIGIGGKMQKETSEQKNEVYMTKDQYLASLHKQIRRLPSEDREKAMEYFKEYFEEAGEGKEVQAMEHLGTPKDAAAQIIRDMAFRHTQESNESVRRGMNAVWVGILAVCAAPIALPMLTAVAALLLSYIVVVLCLMIAAYLLAVSFLISMPFLIFGALLLVANDFPSSICTLGVGLLMAGVGVFLISGTTKFGKLFIKHSLRVINRLIRKGGKLYGKS
jgi:uncharacterized membrane protein